MTAICSNCSASFICNVSDVSACFCNDYPAVLPVEANTSCMCNACLHLAIVQQVHTVCATMSTTDALENNWIKDLPKSNNLIEGIDYYTENSFYVFTKWHHLKRGYCCKNNCRHCAYGYSK
jgi:hypothetical protein